MEEWRVIPNTGGRYSASSYGRFRFNDKNRLVREPNGGFNYLFITMNGKSFACHRIIAELFIPNPLNLPQVNHKDMNRQNNHPDNLEWCDASYNQKHSYASGKRKHVKRCFIYFPETNETYIRLMRLSPLIKRGDIPDIARAANVHYTNVYTAFKSRPQSWKNLPIIYEAAIKVLSVRHPSLKKMRRELRTA